MASCSPEEKGDSTLAIFQSNMSDSDAKPNINLDLETAFLPAWAQKSSNDNPYAKYEGKTRDHDRDDRRPRGRRDDGPSGFRRGDRSDRPKRSQDRRGNDRRSRPAGNRDRGRPSGGGDRPPYSGGGQRRAGGRNREAFRKERPRKTRQEILASLPNFKVQVIPEEKGVALLAKRIRLQGRAYPLFDIARLITQSLDRFRVRVSTVQPNGTDVPQNLWVCRNDQTLWLTEAEAIDHALSKHLDQYYLSEKTKTDPPKGNFSFVAQCGLSGVLLGPPNYHGYQTKLKELHADRYARMHFERFKSNVKIVHGEEVVAKWLEEQSWTTEYTDKANPEADKLHSIEEVQEHFKQHHMAGAVEEVKHAEVSGDSQKQGSRPMRDLVRFHVEDQRRFPLQLATELSHQFTRQGLQFFKVNKTVTHVSVSRPHYLDLELTPVSESVQKIVQFIEQTEDCNRSKVMEALAPSEKTSSDRDEVAAENATAENKSDRLVDPSAPEEPGTAAGDAAGSVPSTESTKEAVPLEITPEQAAVSSDLHWLIHQGHVIEFSNGKMETAKKPKAQPQKPKPKAKVNTGQKAPASESAPQAQPEAPTPVTAAEPTPVEISSNEEPSPEADVTAEDRAASGGTSSDEPDISTASTASISAEVTRGSQGDNPQTGSPKAPVEDASDDSQAPVNAG